MRNRRYLSAPNNNIQPGGPDRGQPTFFYARTQRNMFTVNIPKDWAKKRELIWTVTVNGKTERAVGWLQLEWEIDPVGGANTGGRSTSPERKQNKPPSITLATVAPAKLPATAALDATLTDDGLPKPSGRRQARPSDRKRPRRFRAASKRQSTCRRSRAGGRGEKRRPARTGGGGGRGQQRPQGPTVAWMVWRGPADVTFARAERGRQAHRQRYLHQTRRVHAARVPNDTLESGTAKFVKVVVQ